MNEPQLPQPPLSLPLAGIVLVDKPYRLSSMSIVRVVKRRLMNSGLPKSTKVGHGGTLDPLASGLMVILVGKATRLCDQIMAGRKRYIAEIDLSRTSSTDDLEGQLTPVDVPTPPTLQQVRSALTGFVGVIMQRPPDHSAVWVDGRRAYDIARKGKIPDIAHRPVEVLSIDLLNYHWPLLTIDVACGKGTYIRSLARDVGAALAVGGVLTQLRRTEVAPFHVDQAWKLDDVPDPFSPDLLLPPPPITP